MSESKISKVRTSRDGDQFHYVWAARRCLPLLSSASSLKAVAIEGVSPLEGQASPGEEVIDIAEYHGSETLGDTSLVRYIQLKHSTVNAAKAWPPSGLKKTIKGFALKCASVQASFGEQSLEGKIEFNFVSNRPIHSAFVEAVEDAAAGNSLRHPNEYAKLEEFTGLGGKQLSVFCKLLHLSGNEEGLWDQRNLLSQDFRHYLSNADADASTQLKELVTRKALSENADNPSITRLDVLRALQVDERSLFPAPSLIQEIRDILPRQQESDIVSLIEGANDTPVIIHAAGGIGKSVFAQSIGSGLPLGSLKILYDCFGNGQYRNASSYRHRHDDAFVQIANELAAHALCYPLIPSTTADASQYMRAFLDRLEQSISSLRLRSKDSLLCIVIDAADNAQMAAEESGHRSFVRDLIREKLPEGIRLVLLCRTHRQESLRPPVNAIRVELKPFDVRETAINLRRVFPEATELDIAEFHRLSSHNPRVQALSLDGSDSLEDALRSLGPSPTTVENAIENLLETSIAKLRDCSAHIEKAQIDRICAGLATLRPFVPLSVLASMSRVSSDTIKSFALDLGRPLLLVGDAIQFFDEPAETWFRERFRPTATELTDFVSNLKPLAERSAYIAASLPPLMLEAGQFNELVALALSSDGLPSANPVEKRDVELQRLQFALKASLRLKRYFDSTRLALKAGGESAAEDRQRYLLQDNLDLAGAFLGNDRVLEIVSRRVFGSNWVGSNHAYEAALLSEKPELVGEARSRFRMAKEWLLNLMQLPDNERRSQDLSDYDILTLVTTSLNIDGAMRCSLNLRSWRPREVSYRVGRKLAGRLVDHGRYEDLNALSLAARNDIYLLLAIIVEFRRVNKVPPKSVVARAVRLASKLSISLENERNWSYEGRTIHAITALVEAAHLLSVGTPATLIALLDRYLSASNPKKLSNRYSSGRFLLLRASVFRAVLAKESITLEELAHEELKKELVSPHSHSHSQEAREFREDIGALLPWIELWANALIYRDTVGDFKARIDFAKEASSKAARMAYSNDTKTSDEVASTWFGLIVQSGNTDPKLFEEFIDWSENLRVPLSLVTFTRLVRLAARSTGQETRAFHCAAIALDRIQNYRQDAESISKDFIDLARAILPVDHLEAAAYFNRAVEVASRIGDENTDRWEALLNLANRGANVQESHPMLAYRFARCAELTYSYLARDKYFSWDSTVEAIAGLCPRSTFTILSRWRDRNFGSVRRILPVATEYLVTQGALDSRVALALICIRADWNAPLLLKQAMVPHDEANEKQSVANFLYRYMELDEQDVKTWREIRSIIIDHGLELPRLNERAQIDELGGYSSELSAENHNPEKEPAIEPLGLPEWDSIFDGVDFRLARDLSQAYKRHRKLRQSYFDEEHFFDEMIKRVPAEHVAPFISIIVEVPHFGIQQISVVFEKFPKSWKQRIAVRGAISESVKTLCRKFCMSISISQNYFAPSLATLSDLSGVAESELIDVVIQAISESAEFADSGRLFTIVELLASKLTNTEAKEALSYGLDLFDSEIEKNDGDGPWVPRLEPPPNIETSIAGYIWGCLAAPQASLRWEAAHVVRAFCFLEQRKPLESLIAFANENCAAAFYDDGLHFYEFHARQWLLIALARCAIDHPLLISPYIDFFIDQAFSSVPHVMIREFSKRAILALLDSGMIPSDDTLRERIKSINISPFPSVSKGSGVASKLDDSKKEGTSEIEYADDDFSFGFDIGPYWLHPLANCFGQSQKTIEREVLHVFKNDWHLSGRNRHNEDARHRQGIFNSEETGHSHGSYPRVDDRQFYLSYHAMMIVAGKLLAKLPVYHDPSDPEDEFQDWLKRHDFLRSGGAWVADRRDPAPLEEYHWQNEMNLDEWRYSIDKSDFERALISHDGRLNLWGCWTKFSEYREVTICVHSALVSSDCSVPLMCALQTVDNYHDYGIPAAGENSYLKIDSKGFQLKGWIVESDPDSGIDGQDPWAGSIDYPPLYPAPYIIEAMNLTSEDHYYRRWKIEGTNSYVAWAQTWGSFEEKYSNQKNPERGRRFQASLEFALSLLAVQRMDLIVEVRIKRDDRYSHSRGSKDNGFGYVPSSTRIFVLKADGHIRSL